MYPNAHSLRTSTIILALALVASLAPAAWSQQAATPDPSRNFITIVPHINSHLQRGKPGNPATGDFALPSFGGSPYHVGPTIVPTSTVPEGEEHIAVDPNNFKNLVAMISDFSQNGGFNTSKFAISKDNGATWAENFVPLSNGFPATSDNGNWQANSDPVVAIDKQGRVFLENLYLAVDQFGNVPNDGLYVCVGSISTGFQKSNCNPVKTSLVPVSFIEDKPWMAVDNSNSNFSGSVYASWTHFTTTSNAILFSRSTDHGKTWSTAIQISPNSQNGAVQGSQVAVGPSGEIYIAWEAFLTGTQVQHYIAVSTNGGSSFGTAVKLTPVFNDLTFSAPYRFNSFPALAVSPVAGKAFVYDVYANQPGSNSRISAVRSKTAGSTTFVGPVTLNDSSQGQRLMPAVAVDRLGVVHTSWFDTRNSSSTNLLDIFATYSKNAGAVFAPNAKANSKQIDAGQAGFIGDYAGIAAAPGSGHAFAHPVWTNGGVGGSTNGQLSTSTLSLP